MPWREDIGASKKEPNKGFLGERVYLKIIIIKKNITQTNKKKPHGITKSSMARRNSNTRNAPTDRGRTI